MKYGTALLFEESDVVFSAEVNLNLQIESKQQALEVGAGLRLPLAISEDLYLRGGINTGVLQAIGTPTIRGAIALQYDPRTHFRKRVYAFSSLEKRCVNNASIQCPDSDNDGIQDWIDICPLQPETINGITDGDGCPEGRPQGQIYTDSIINVIQNDVEEEPLGDPVSETEVVKPLSNESLNNTHDIEVANPELVEEQIEEKGDVAYNIDISDLEIVGEHDDRDEDGIVDLEDLCIAEPEDSDGFLDNDGCPDNDNDEDGIPDKWDACPLLASLNQGGCPDGNDEFFWDFDNDGIADTDDLCWEIPETINAFDDHDGCPDEIPSELVEIAGTVEGIKFRTGSARLSSSSNDTLRKVRKALRKYPQLTLSIEGHTDDVGKRERNIVLSEDRALAVEEWLLKKGIEKERISSVGFGPDNPMGDNETEEGRTENRRVEMLYRMNVTDSDTDSTDGIEGNEQENNETKIDKKGDTTK
jgi:outer membrane protein OmpA-like peptidoglycan-associated protein